jgi:hypothetical protein
MLKKPRNKAAGEIKAGGVASVGYVEDFDEPRTQLRGFFSTLLFAQRRFGL